MARKIVLILGLFVALLSYLGFPEALDTTLYTIFGLLIAFLAWSGKRPAPVSSFEEMEGELHDATQGNPSHQEKALSTTEQVASSGGTLSSAIRAQEKQREGEPQTFQESDKTVSVAFAKHRSRNLKKRITQEGSEQIT